MAFEVNSFITPVCKHIKLKLVSVHDSEFILNLRLDSTLNKHVSRVKNDLEKQKKWILDYKNREQNKKEYYFIIESLNGDQYGAVRLYDLKDESFCWGSWMIQRDSPSYASIESALSIYEFAFYTLGFQRSHFDVRIENKQVVKFHERFGAKRILTDTIDHHFNFERTDYEITKLRYKRYFV